MAAHFSITCRKPSRRPHAQRGGFTLLELLVVIAIIGILAAISLPAFRGLGQGRLRAAAVRQVLDDLGLARQLALKNRTTVYMVFVPPTSDRELFTRQRQKLTGYLADPALKDDRAHWEEVVLRAFTNAVSGQSVGYALFARRSIGDQPGFERPRYLTEWRSLPEGTLFPTSLFTTNRFNGQTNHLALRTIRVPFPVTINRGKESLILMDLPYLAFNSNGQLEASVIARPDVYLAISEGSIFLPRTATGQLDLRQAPDIIETPRGNYTNSFIRIAGLTGRAKLEKPEFR